MKAVVVDRCGEAVWREVGDPPEPGPYEALVRTTAFSICNATDLHIRDCRLMGATAEACPFLLGHESVGDVIELGPNCRYLRQGHQIFRPMLSLPGYGSWWGGMAQYGLVTDRRAWQEDGSPPGPGGHQHQQVIPPEIAPDHAVVLITLKEVLSYLRMIHAREGGRLLVTGQGPVGLAAVYLGRRLIGSERIVVAGRRPETQAQVHEFGADAYVDTREEGWPALAIELLGGPADVVYETTGDALVTAGGLEALAADGTLGPYAARTDEQALEPLPQDDRYGPRGTDESLVHDEMMAAMLAGRVDPERFITHRLEPEQIQHAFGLIACRKALKIVFTP